MALFVPGGPSKFYELDRFTTAVRGLYHLTAFDVFILIPYLSILTILAVYGIHRYHLVYLFLKNKNNGRYPKERLKLFRE